MCHTFIYSKSIPQSPEHLLCARHCFLSSKATLTATQHCTESFFTKLTKHLKVNKWQRHPPGMNLMAHQRLLPKQGHLSSSGFPRTNLSAPGSDMGIVCPPVEVVSPATPSAEGNDEEPGALPTSCPPAWLSGGQLEGGFPIISDARTKFMFSIYIKLFGPNFHVNCSDQKCSMSVKFGWIIRQHSQDQEHVA